MINTLILRGGGLEHYILVSDEIALSGTGEVWLIVGRGRISFMKRLTSKKFIVKVLHEIGAR